MGQEMCGTLDCDQLTSNLMDLTKGISRLLASSLTQISNSSNLLQAARELRLLKTLLHCWCDYYRNQYGDASES